MIEANPQTLCLLPGEVRRRVRDAQATLISVRQNPYGEGPILPAIRRHLRQIDPQQQGRLLEAFHTVFPLCGEEALIQKKTGDIDIFTVATAMFDLMNYQADFTNTGVRRVSSQFGEL